MQSEIWDTSVYITKIRVREDWLIEAHEFHYLSAVVAAELATGFVQKREVLAEYEKCVNRFKLRNRLITPTAYDWYLTGLIIGEIISRRPNLKNKRALLFNDCLIATSSRIVNAKVVTANKTDFELIRKWLNFEVKYIS